MLNQAQLVAEMPAISLPVVTGFTEWRTLFIVDIRITVFKQMLFETCYYFMSCEA